MRHKCGAFHQFEIADLYGSTGIKLSSYYFGINLFCQIYIGGLRSDSDKYDVEEAFAQYGKVSSTAVALNRMSL